MKQIPVFIHSEYFQLQDKRSNVTKFRLILTPNLQNSLLSDISLYKKANRESRKLHHKTTTWGSCPIKTGQKRKVKTIIKKNELKGNRTYASTEASTMASNSGLIAMSIILFYFMIFEKYSP